jgi:glycosyltransferase involved in cell wall biosynthesis
MNTQQMNRSLVSVIIPTYNRRKWLGQCLDSVLRQTYQNVETIVVDDYSTDDTVDWLKSQTKYDKIKLRVQEKNGGASIARNTGIDLAEGDLIIFIDSDDMLLPKHIETAVEHFNRYPDLGLFCCDSTMIDADGNVILGGKTWHQALSEAKNIDVQTGFRSLADVFSYSNCFPGFALRREVFETEGGFDQPVFPADDYDLALRVAGSDFKVFYLHEPLCLRREHDGQCSGIQNSVKTCVKLTEVLKNAVKRDPEKFNNRSAVRRRLAEIELEMGISQMKAGISIAGARTMASSLLKDPMQLGRVATIGRRKIRSFIKPL